MSESAVLVPVARSQTLRSTVGNAIEQAVAGPGRIRFIFVHPPEDIESDTGRQLHADADQLLDQVRSWAEEDAGDRAEELTIETAHVGQDRPLYSPEAVAEAIAESARETDCRRVILDPEYNPGVSTPLIRPLLEELSWRENITAEEATVERPVHRATILESASLVRMGAIFLIGFGFYLLLAGTITTFDVVTGVVSAALVAVALARITFGRDPDRYSPLRMLRMVVYVPYLIWEIILSNFVIARTILHPDLPIKPRMVEFDPAVRGALPLTTLGNSITLTPGTLTVRAQDGILLIHTLVPWARDGLSSGTMERAVRYVFYGRQATKIPTPTDRDDISYADDEGDPK